ncbi:MAG: Hsp70 family protein [Verrucomicrobiota bacterium]
MASYRIGIDLGTTNCALASISVADAGGQTTVLGIPQQETAHSSFVSPTLPSFLFLSPDAGDKSWTTGRWARTRAGEVPGRTIASAKSWMVHHAVDRRGRFLPLGTAEIPPEDQLSPVAALALLLRKLAHAWNEAHPEAPLIKQELAITVPASFDPAAQQLTLEAAKEAGFPEETLLLEEPQAAFYAWLEKNPEGISALRSATGTSHILVIDIGGGTTDFSLFAVDSEKDHGLPRLHRIAVSEHLLLGGDNLDYALAHFLEQRMVPESQLPAGTFAQLLARCREIKEECLSNGGDLSKSWPVAVAKPGASLLSGSIRAEITTAEIHKLLLGGFFPRVNSGERPLKAVAGLREMGLPYAKEAAITRHLAGFLRGRGLVDYVLFNGGLTKSPAIREIFLEHITRWQDGAAPGVLENVDPDLAVACGAARYLFLKAAGDPSKIEAGASHSYYIDVGGGQLMCVLPMGTPAEVPQLATRKGLKALIGKPATFALLRHNRRPQDEAGVVVRRDDSEFTELPFVEAVLKPSQGAKLPKESHVRIKVRATLRATGLLKVELLCDEPALRWGTPWPLEFSLRGNVSPSSESAGDASSLAPETVEQTKTVMAAFLNRSGKVNEKLTGNALFAACEKSMGSLKHEWSGGMVRALFDVWLKLKPNTFSSPDAEECWFQVAGYLLRPGCGMFGDSERVAAMAELLNVPSEKASGAVKIQRWICARRIASGLGQEESIAIWNMAAKEWREGRVPSAEIALLAGALEALPSELRSELARRLTKAILANPQNAALWKGLGRLLSRVLFHAGPEHVLSPELVVEIWDQLGACDIAESMRSEVANMWLRAARLTGLRPIDIPKGCRHEIGMLLRSWGIAGARCNGLSEVVAVVSGDQVGLLGESLPAGLSLEY